MVMCHFVVLCGLCCADGVRVFAATPSADTVVIQLQLDRGEDNVRLESVVGFRS
jgi:hypothetical protein